MNESLKSRYEKAELLEISSTEDATSEYLKILEEAKLSDAFILSTVGRKLRKLGRSQLFIDKIKQYPYEEVKKRKYVNDAYLYCLYSVEIAQYVYVEETFENFINTAKLITDNCEQLGVDQFNFNPYVLTVYKVVQVLKHRASTSYFQELKWINKLNPELLPIEPKEIQAQNGRTYEMASYKEFYYQVKTKCLEKIEKFEECIKLCETALYTFEKLHYGNRLWFSARELYCECLKSGNKEDIEHYREIAEEHHFWYMYHKLANLYFSYGDVDKALYYSCKAILSDVFDQEKMINLIFDIGMLFENTNNSAKAKSFYEAALYYRSSLGWFLPEELRFAEKEFNLARNQQPNIVQLKNYALEAIKKVDSLKFGIISNINLDKKYGFIKYDGNKSMYFSLKIIKIRPKLNDKVYFKIGTINDKPCAVDIYKIGR